MAFPALTRMHGSSRVGREKSGYCEGSRGTWRSLVARVPAHGGPVLEHDRYRLPPATPYERLIGKGLPGRPLIHSSLFALRDRLIFVECVLAAVPRPRALIESLGDGHWVNRLQVHIQYYQVVARLQSTPGGAIDRRHIAGAVEHTANLNDDMRRLDLADEQETIFPDQRSITVHADSSPPNVDLIDQVALNIPLCHSPKFGEAHKPPSSCWFCGATGFDGLQVYRDRLSVEHGVACTSETIILPER
jgi:hypothetical protein